MPRRPRGRFFDAAPTSGHTRLRKMSGPRLAPWLVTLCLALFALIAIPWVRAAASAGPENTTDQAGERSVKNTETGPEAPAPSASVAPAAPVAQPVLGPMAFDARAQRYTASYGAGDRKSTRLNSSHSS